MWKCFSSMLSKEGVGIFVREYYKDEFVIIECKKNVSIINLTSVLNN